ncbi:efflux transporter outer membrane subunit [Oxalobacteraceae bacterium A2-2]
MSIPTPPSSVRWRRLAFAAAALALAGCAQVAPDQHPLAQRDVANTALAPDIKLAREGWPEARWWSVYHDDQLDALMQQALAGAPSLEVAAARIGTAQAAVTRSLADLGVDASAYAAANRQRYSGTGLFPAPIGGAYFSEQTLRLDLRYNFDWWGKNKARIKAAIGQDYASRAAQAEAEQALTAAIAQHYFSLQGAWARQANLDRLIAAQQEVVQDRAKRIARGLADADSQRAAEAELRQLKKQRAQFVAEAATEREALRALLGADAAALAGLQPRPLGSAPHALPARLGVELLARRPDLQAARWKVEAALSRIDAARAAFYPDLNLTGSVGLDTIKFEDLLKAASRTVFIGPTLTLPLFDSKRLDAQLEGARSERNELVAEYNQAVVQAVREVAQDGIQLQGLEQQISEQAAASGSAAGQLRSAQARLARGLADRNTVLMAQEALLKQQDNELYLRQLQLLAEVALVNSLGGGYRAAAAPAAP